MWLLILPSASALARIASLRAISFAALVSSVFLGLLFLVGRGFTSANGSGVTAAGCGAAGASVAIASEGGASTAGGSGAAVGGSATGWASGRAAAPSAFGRGVRAFLITVPATAGAIPVAVPAAVTSPVSSSSEPAACSPSPATIFMSEGLRIAPVRARGSIPTARPSLVRRAAFATVRPAMPAPSPTNGAAASVAMFAGVVSSPAVRIANSLGLLAASFATSTRDCANPGSGATYPVREVDVASPVCWPI